MAARIMDGGKPQLKRCDFFLWDDEAKPREAAAVLHNSRSEPRSTPQTPSRLSGARYRPSTPEDRSRTASPDPVTPYTPSKTHTANIRKTNTGHAEEDESYDWPASDEDELSKAADHASTTTMPPPETPRKAARTDIFTTPGKRRHEEMENGAGGWPTPSPEDAFTTPSTGLRGMDLFSTGSAAGLLSPAETPTPQRFKDAIINGSGEKFELVKDVIQTLQESFVHMDETAREAIKTVLTKHALKAQGIAKGRDISRLAIKSKDAKITELQGRIADLEAERETNRAVIRHLRRDMEAARKK
ncbi:MAG: hypothetical protein M1830_009292 [Pleopsidium flavum]|nr:MAG: hypothetical protein M1830_010192 [Pleopsidium flavum]KAI9874783.1 MAG: hypothetical protein M1830_009292 [Pleopsidium flavum]